LSVHFPAIYRCIRTMSKRKKDEESEEAESSEDSKQKDEGSGSAQEDDDSGESEEDEKKTQKKKQPAKKATTTTKQPARKPPKKKARKGPKRPTTAYAFYLKAKRPEFQEKNPGMKFIDLSKKISAQWKTLGDADKKDYTDLYEKDKKRYQDELKTFKPSSSESDDSSDDNKKKGKVKGKKKTKRERDPNQPKQATNAYMFFQKERRESIKKQYPELKTLPLMAKKMGEIWKGFTEEDKRPFVEMATKDKKRYEVDMALYKKQNEEKEAKKDNEDDEEKDDESEEDSE